MSLLNFAGGFANAFNAATDAAESMSDRNAKLEARQAARDDIKYKDEDREYVRKNRQRDDDDRENTTKFENEVASILNPVDDVESPEVESTPSISLANTTPTDSAPTQSVLPAEPATAAPIVVSSKQSTKKPINPNSPDTLRAIAAAALKHHKIDQFLNYRGRADELSWKDSADAVFQLRVTSGGMAPIDVVKKAGEIFANDIGAGRIEDITENPDGSISFVSVNSSNGQKFKRTVKTAEEALSQLEAFYTPDNFKAVHAANVKAEIDAEKERRKMHNVAPGNTVLDGNGKPIYTAPNRLRVGGIGGGGRSGGGQEPGRMDYSQGVKFNDVYQKNLAFQLDRLKGDPLMGGEPPNEEQVDKAAKTAYAMTAQQMGAIKTGSRKAEQEGAISKALFPLRSGRGADPDKYAGVRAQLLDRGYSDAVMTAMGYPPPSGAFSVVKDGKMISRGTSAR